MSTQILVIYIIKNIKREEKVVNSTKNLNTRKKKKDLPKNNLIKKRKI